MGAPGQARQLQLPEVFRAVGQPNASWARWGIAVVLRAPPVHVCLLVHLFLGSTAFWFRCYWRASHCVPASRLADRSWVGRGFDGVCCDLHRAVDAVSKVRADDGSYGWCHCSAAASRGLWMFASGRNLVDPASSHMLFPKTKPCMSQCQPSPWQSCEWLITTAVASMAYLLYMDTCGNSRANTCVSAQLLRMGTDS